MRNLNKSEPLKQRIAEDNLDIEILRLDVTDTASIQSTVDSIIEKDGKIDILLNNAGAGFAKTVEQTSEKEIRWVTEVNYLGSVFCTKAVLPFMRKSVGGLVGQPFNELYCGAKFAVEGFMEGLATYVSDAFNIKISCVEPGGITTEFMNSAVKNTASDGQLATGEYLPIFEIYMAGTKKRASESKEQVYQTPEQIAEILLQVAKEENPPLRLRTSQWAENFTALKTQTDPDGKKIIQQVRTN